MRLLITFLFTILTASLVNALVIVPDNVNNKRQLDIPSSILLAAEKSASALAAAYVSSLNSKLNAKTATEPEESLPTQPPAGPTPLSPPPAASNPNEAITPTITSPSSPSSTVYAWTSYVTVATVTTYVWTGTGTPTGWPFETTMPPPPLGPAENAAPAMLVSGVFTGMVAVVFSVIVLLIV